jgi:hypothetical protein
MKISDILKFFVRQENAAFDGTIVFPVSAWARIPPSAAYPWINNVSLSETLPFGTRICFVSGPTALDGINLNLPGGISPSNTIPYNSIADGAVLTLQNEQNSNCQLRSGSGTTSTVPTNIEIVLGYYLP